MTNPHTTHRMSLIRSEVAKTLAAFAGAKKALGMAEEESKEARG